MQPQSSQEKKRKPIGQPVEDESDDDPDFVRGPIPQPSERQTEKTKSGKRRRSKGKQDEDTRPPPKRRRVTGSELKPSVLNPLIGLLRVEKDPYFRKLILEDDEKVISEGTLQATMDERKISEKLLSIPSQPLVPSNLGQENEDSVTEDDDVTEDEDEDEDSPSLDLESFKRNVSANEIIRSLNGQITKAESRRLKRLRDPEATESESESDDPPVLSLPLNIKSLQGFIVPELNPRPQFGPYPQNIEPYRLGLKGEAQIPAPINAHLRPYQREGVQFLFERYRDGRGAILGDDMGLGKTVQVISFLSAIMQKHGDERDQLRRYLYVDELLEAGYCFPRSIQEKPRRPLPPPSNKWPTCLLVVPLPLIENWKSELETWGYFEFGVYESGSTTTNKEKNRHILLDFKMGRLDLVLISMSTLIHRILEFCDLDWSVIIVDEAHKLKNPARKTVQALSKFQRGCRFGLTGTAIQNNYEELWALLNWANRDSVGTLAQWKHSISIPITKGLSKTATPKETERAMTVSKNLVEKLLPHFFLRRTKDLLVDQLPKKIDQVAFCPLTKKQKEVYRRFLDSEDMKAMLSKDKSVQPGKVLEYINIFIKISNSIALILPVKGEKKASAEISRKLQAIAFPNVSNRELFAPMQANPEEFCGKWRVLRGLLNDWREENDSVGSEEASPNVAVTTRRHKVLIFTKSRKLLDLVEHTLQYEGYDYRLLHGNLKDEERQKSITDFQTDPNVFVFLITTQTGGVGLNLTAANKVIIFDPNWNPAQDLQAMDRAFRLGQVRDVEVFRLLGGGSIEELIYKRQVYKQQMMVSGYEAREQMRYFDAVQGDKQKQGELFGIKNLFALTEGDTVEKIERARLREDIWRLQAESEGVDSPVLGLLIDDNQLMRHGAQHVLFGDELLLPKEEQVKLHSGRLASRKAAEVEEPDRSPRRRSTGEGWVPRHSSRLKKATKAMKLSDSE
ncbi:hypothetical protein FRC17_000512 [Serendipita sp. 399]|nr:hypothetical protein FRC17_000512 [Serendipita sp. 399]